MESTNFTFVVQTTFFDGYYCEVNYREMFDEHIDLLTQFIDDTIKDGLNQYVLALGLRVDSWKWIENSNYFIVYAHHKNSNFNQIKREIKFFFAGTFTNILDSVEYFDMKCNLLDFDNNIPKEIGE